MYIVQVILMSEEPKIEIEEEEPVIELETRADKYIEWEKNLKSYQRDSLKRGFNLSLKSFPDVAKQLQYLREIERQPKNSVIGKVLRKHFSEFFKLPAPIETELETVGGRLIKIIKKTEKLLNVYDKHTGFTYSFSRALGHKWQEEKSNWKKYHDLITSAIEKLETGVIPTSELHEISSLDLFKITGPELLNRIKNIEKEVASKEDLEKLKNLGSDITGAMGFVTKIEKLIKKYREMEMEE